MVGPKFPHTATRNADPGLCSQPFDQGGSLLDRIQALQLRKSQLQRQRTELVAARAVLHHKSDLQEADQVGVGFADRHAGGLAQVAKRHRRHVAAERHQELGADLNRLNASTRLFHGVLFEASSGCGKYIDQGFS